MNTKYNLILDVNSSILSLLGKRLKDSMDMLKSSLRNLEKPYDANKEEMSNISPVSDEEKNELLSLFGNILRLFLVQDEICVTSASQSLSSFYRLLSLYDTVSFPQMNPTIKEDLENVLLLLNKRDDSLDTMNTLNLIGKKFGKEG